MSPQPIFSQSKIKNQKSSFINPLFLSPRKAGTRDPENGGRFTVKKYHSAKTATSPVFFSQISASQLFRFSAFTPLVVGEWVASID